MGGDEQPAARPAVPDVLTPENFAKIGIALNGKHWQADIATSLGCSKSQVTRYLKRSTNTKNHRDLNPLVARQLQWIVNERIRSLAAVLDTPGMPYADTPEVQEAIAAISRVLTPLKGQEPPRPDEEE